MKFIYFVLFQYPSCQDSQSPSGKLPVRNVTTQSAFLNILSSFRVSLPLESRRLEVLNLVALVLLRKGNCDAENRLGVSLYIRSYHANISFESKSTNALQVWYIWNILFHLVCIVKSFFLYCWVRLLLVSDCWASFFIKLYILVPRGCDPFGQHQESRPLASPNFGACTENSFYKLYWRLSSANHFCQIWQWVHESRTSGVGSDQRSRFLVLTKRITASGDENENFGKHSPFRWTVVSLHYSAVCASDDMNALVWYF